MRRSKFTNAFALAGVVAIDAAGATTRCDPKTPTLCVWMVESAGATDSVRREGARAYSFAIAPGDRWADETIENNAERSEIRQLGNLPIGKPFTFAFTTQSQSDAPKDSKWLVIGQLHQASNPDDVRTSPPFAQYIYNGSVFETRIRFSSLFPLSKQPSGRSLYRGVIDLKKPNRFSYCIVYGAMSQGGRVDGWINGKHLISYRGPVGYISPIGPFAKLGIYRDPSHSGFSLDYTDIVLKPGCSTTST